jgi:hypothetical protein
MNPSQPGDQDPLINMFAPELASPESILTMKCLASDLVDPMPVETTRFVELVSSDSGATLLLTTTARSSSGFEKPSVSATVYPAGESGLDVEHGISLSFEGDNSGGNFNFCSLESLNKCLGATEELLINLGQLPQEGTALVSAIQQLIKALSLGSDDVFRRWDPFMIDLEEGQTSHMAEVMRRICDRTKARAEIKTKHFEVALGDLLVLQIVKNHSTWDEPYDLLGVPRFIVSLIDYSQYVETAYYINFDGQEGLEVGTLEDAALENENDHQLDAPEDDLVQEFMNSIKSGSVPDATSVQRLIDALTTVSLEESGLVE